MLPAGLPELAGGRGWVRMAARTLTLSRLHFRPRGAVVRAGGMSARGASSHACRVSCPHHAISRAGTCITRHTPDRVGDWRKTHSRGAARATGRDLAGDWRIKHGGVRHAPLVPIPPATGAISTLGGAGRRGVPAPPTGETRAERTNRNSGPPGRPRPSFPVRAGLRPSCRQSGERPPRRQRQTAKPANE